MKPYMKIVSVIALALLSSCVDDSKLDFSVEKPGSIAQYEYLLDYDVLKNYVDRNANPLFKLGVGISASDYNSKGFIYGLINSNFDEVIAGNDMKYAAIVRDDGSMDFSTVSKFVETAQIAGVSIYGHTLCWHSQQNNTYLNELIAPTIIPGEDVKVEYIGNRNFEGGNIDGWYGWGGDNIAPSLSASGEGHDGGYAIKVQNNGQWAYWQVQFAYTGFENSTYLANGTPCKISFWVRGEGSGVVQAEVQSRSTYAANGFGSITPTSEWKYYEFTTTVTEDTRDHCLFSYGEYDGTLFFDDISLTQVVSGSGGAALDVNLIANGNFETGDASAWNGWGNNMTIGISASGQGYGDRGYALEVTNPSKTGGSWEVQSLYPLSEPLKQGGTYYLKMKVKGTADGIIKLEAQSNDYSSNGFGDIAVTTDWKEVELSTVISASDRSRFIVSYGDYEGTVYIDDVSLKWLNPNGAGQTIEKTEEEKKELITVALETWIAGMMEACGGYVKSWDVVNEPMSDWPDPTQLKSDPDQTNKDNFYWQDYLGKDYARTAIKFARQYGGDDLKLFINEYGLEGVGNEKCKGLIQIVEYWESDATTKIDGIGNQMHVTLQLDKEKQQANEDAIVDMYKLLAATGKLIKVSELDMGIVDEEGNTIKTDAITFEQQQAMSDFYKFIVQKYFEIIPASQQYGITQWCTTDSPEDSGWRAGEPVGLWDLNYSRKPTYGGFADGLASKK